MSEVNKLHKILELVEEYIEEKRENEEWKPGEDWVSYSGPHYDKEEYREAIKTLLGEWLIFGKNANKFELLFPEYLGTKYGSLVNSGSSANLLMMAALKSKKGYNIPEGSKIITPVVGFPTTINPIIQLGFKPVFVDVTLPDLNLDLDQVEEILKKDPDIKAIMFAHVLGNPPDMDRLMEIVDQYNLIFLEDTCDALGSYYKGRKLGSYGHISTCSFFPAHHMTMGEGGFVSTNDYKIKQAVTSLRDWGRACFCNIKKPGCVTSGTACGNRFKNWLPGLKDTVYDHRYVFDDIGYNLKPLDLQASMGLQQLNKLPDMDKARRENFNKLQAIFEPYEQYLHLPTATEGSDPCWFAYLMTVQDNAPFKKENIVNYLENAKIQTRSYFAGNILLHPGYNHLAEEYGDLNKSFPVAQKATTSSFFLGTFIGMTDDKIQYIKKVVDEFFKQVEG
jgi:CDP-6-deoxy-D-xylo-4-hexulose-3-dehydrase